MPPDGQESSSVWSALGYSAYAPANPLRGVISDGDYVRTFLSTIQGPVVLAGHSYGGSVITNASAGAPNVRALVYIAAYAPDEGDEGDEGETLAADGALDGASNDLAGHLLVRPYPGRRRRLYRGFDQIHQRVGLLNASAHDRSHIPALIPV